MYPSLRLSHVARDVEEPQDARCVEAMGCSYLVLPLKYRWILDAVQAMIIPILEILEVQEKHQDQKEGISCS
ncbi:hypothetical protein Tco_1308369 [Tanacetum coccineum]